MLVRILIPIVILAAGFGAWKWLGIPVEEPQPARHAPQKLKTERLELSLTDFPVVLETQGTIRAHHSTTITSLVPGTIQKVHPNFEDGAFFNEGDVLAELDPADLQAALTAAESRLARAEAALAQEEARAKQAKLNWEDIGYDEEPSPLVLRIPQLKEANAVITSARADLDQAQRNLDRAKIRAPFDGRVKARLVGLGQSVSGTTPLGEVFATDYAEIRLPLSANQLPFVNLPSSADDTPVNVTLTDALAGNTATGSASGGRASCAPRARWMKRPASCSPSPASMIPSAGFPKSGTAHRPTGPGRRGGRGAQGRLCDPAHRAARRQPRLSDR
jgi:multidrug efflux pump subunit AcrA (membrane-fusion protein)